MYHVDFFFIFMASFLAATAGLFPDLFGAFSRSFTLRDGCEATFLFIPRTRPDLVAVAPCQDWLAFLEDTLVYVEDSEAGSDCASVILSFLPFKTFPYKYV